jgi:hypothetical protein
MAPPALHDAEVRFAAPYAMDASAEVALEDYARVLARAAEAEALRPEEEPPRVAGVRLVAPRAELTAGIRRDIEAFARDLADRGGGNGLGWA